MRSSTVEGDILAALLSTAATPDKRKRIKEKIKNGLEASSNRPQVLPLRS